jgi:polysaccharide deacetylase family protein (PEP-CTERM system associated)
MPITNYLTIDVEDYYHVSAFEKVSPPSTWMGRESRVERNTNLVLAILDESSVKATFFVLGWVAEHCPDLVKRIASEGHEIASHGYGHQRVCNQSRQEFREDIRRSKKILEDISGQPVLGYRAPSYSITRQTDWAFDELVDAGYQYDSSIFPIKHDFYGIPDWPRFSGYAVQQGDCWVASQTHNSDKRAIREIPITTLKLGRKNLPIAGGGYFRLLPYAVTHWGLQRINKQDQQPFVFYLHPWEFDPQQPRMTGCSAKSRFRHYLNLHKTEQRFTRLIQDFKFSAICEVLSNRSADDRVETPMAGHLRENAPKTAVTEWN